ncbi:hypothetical protein LguiB_034152 [Lonicera macranthoides]
MADEFQIGVCASNWWNPSRTTFGSSPCSSLLNDIGSLGWASDESASKSMFFQDIQKPHQSTDWNQTLLCGNGSGDSDYNPVLEENMNSSLDCGQEDFSINMFKPVNQNLLLDQESLNSYSYPSTLLQASFNSEFQPQQSLFDNESIKYPCATNNYMTKFNDIGASFAPSTFEEKSNCSKLAAKFQVHNEEVRENGYVVKNSNHEPAFKRLRIETPSPLPTFKVRKEKLGDRITALQQLVSPFGKTDTASVLHEAVEYINLLHAQVNVLSTQYMKNGAPIQQQLREPSRNNLKDTKGPDLRSRGLCLVPISSTFPVAAETTTEFWTPTFGGAFC